MRILTLTNVPLDKRFGSAYVALGYAQGLRDHGHVVDIFGPETLEKFKFLRWGKQLRTALGMWWHVLHHAAKGQYDVVELYGGQTCLAAGYLQGLKNRNFLVVAHTNGIEMHFGEAMRSQQVSQRHLFPSWIRRWTNLPVSRAFLKVDGIVTVSEFDGRYARRKRLQPESRLKTIENPLPNDFLGLQVSMERSPVIGFAAPWSEMKGANIVAEALPLVLRKFGNARLRLIGVGRGFRKQEHFPADVCHQIEVLADGVSRDHLRDHFMEMAVVIMPSYFESFGLVAAEAMACGCSVVASCTGFAESLKHEENVMLMTHIDGTSLAESLVRLLSNEELRRKIATNGWKRVQKLRWDLAVCELERTYTEWLSQIRERAGAGDLQRA